MSSVSVTQESTVPLLPSAPLSAGELLCRALLETFRVACEAAGPTVIADLHLLDAFGLGCRSARDALVKTSATPGWRIPTCGKRIHEVRYYILVLFYFGQESYAMVLNANSIGRCCSEAP